MKQKILSANHCGWCGLWSGSLNAAGDCLTCAASVVYWGWWANSVAEGNHGGITVVSHDVHSLQVAGG
ncbi:hypothetical protein N9H39_01030 [Gammaproteobacteria bacterium]|nr:hypothetical protein [Gammaproteobacteria bacterium]